MKRKTLLTSFVITLLGFLAFVGTAQRVGNFLEEFLANPSGNALTQVYGNLKHEYLYDVEDEKLTQGAIKGMIEALDDPFTYYSEPETAAMRNQNSEGEFEGIGAMLNVVNQQTGEGTLIVNVYLDGPAWKAGIKPGDVFHKVDDVVVDKMTPTEVAKIVRGPKGTKVRLEMIREGEDKPIVFDIIRAKIDIVSAESLVLENNVGYIWLKTFDNAKLYDQMVEQLDRLKAKGITSLILDLRDNGGGQLQQGILVADEFLDSGDIVFQRAKGLTQRIAKADNSAFKLPMVVLVNKNSASASEIVAGALQDNKRAKIVGETTFGKGVAQNVIGLVDGGQLAYVVFEWLTPNKRSIHKTGIIPEIFAEDNRYPPRLSLQGKGDPGRKIEIYIDGENYGSTVVDKDGEFSFVTPYGNRQFSAEQGVAIVDIDNDNALKIAYETILKEQAN